MFRNVTNRRFTGVELTQVKDMLSAIGLDFQIMTRMKDLEARQIYRNSLKRYGK